MQNRPPFPADHVGSLLRPPALLAARERRRAGELDAAGLARIEDEAIRDVVAKQESLGFQVATDGEFRRTLWHRDFLESFTNVTTTRSPVAVRFHSDEGDVDRSPSAFRVGGRLARARPIVVEGFRFLRSVARVEPKVTIPSPTVLHFRGGRDAVDRQAYPDMDTFFADLATAYARELQDLWVAGCRYVQVDEVNFAYLCDPRLRDEVRRFGEDPDSLPHTYARLLNAALGARPAGMTVCLHLCRGNLESMWLAEGGYEPVADTLFNEVEVDGYFLEYDSPRAGDFAPLRFLPGGKRVVLGLVTTKGGALEARSDIERRIDEASRVVPLERLALSPQCGFASGERGNHLTEDEQWAKLSLVAEVAREVWR